MQEIIEIIKASTAKPDWWTIIPTIVSAAAAIVAIAISVRTSQKQNKIALFEKRLGCYQRFMALKRFSDFANRFDSFEKQEQLDPIFQCQAEYLDVHGMLNDERSTQNMIFRNMGGKYAMACLDKDSELLTSIKLLIKIKNEDALIKLENTLQKFVKILFSSRSSTESLKMVQQELFAAFEDAESCCVALRRSAKMYYSLSDFLKKLGGRKHVKT